jgi:hypothetical protein
LWNMDKTADAPRIEGQDFDHLGLVADIIDETGLVEEIDEGWVLIPRSTSVVGER